MSAPVTLVGRLIKDPELKFSNSGKAVATFVIVTAKRRQNKDTKEWEDYNTSFWDCVTFGSLAENVCESLEKGTLTIVQGEAHQEKYKNKEGQDRSVWKVTVNEAGPSLRWAAAKTQAGGQKDQSGNWGQREKAPF